MIILIDRSGFADHERMSNRMVHGREVLQTPDSCVDITFDCGHQWCLT